MESVDCVIPIAAHPQVGDEHNNGNYCSKRHFWFIIHRLNTTNGNHFSLTTLDNKELFV